MHTLDQNRKPSKILRLQRNEYLRCSRGNCLTFSAFLEALFSPIRVNSSRRHRPAYISQVIPTKYMTLALWAGMILSYCMLIQTIAYQNLVPGVPNYVACTGRYTYTRSIVCHLKVKMIEGGIRTKRFHLSTNASNSKFFFDVNFQPVFWIQTQCLRHFIKTTDSLTYVLGGQHGQDDLQLHMPARWSEKIVR